MVDTPLAEAFFSCAGSPEPAGCWPWLGKRLPAGYGVLHIDGSKHLATHLALNLTGKMRPEGAVALHRCDNPPCCNPDHLRWGTQADNMHDMASKGRASRMRGTASPLARLTDDAVREIRLSPLPNPKLAARYGVDKSKICRIKNRKAWAHVED